MYRIRLKEILDTRDVSQARLSRMADVSMNTIQLLYHDPHHDTLISTLVKVAKALNVRLEELVEMEE